MSHVVRCDVCRMTAAVDAPGWGTYRLTPRVAIGGQQQLDLCPSCCTAVDRLLSGRVAAVAVGS